MTRNQCAARLRGLARVHRWQSAFEHGLVRGRCANPRCQSRYATVRNTYDFRDAREVIKNAELVCAECDRVWHRARPIALAEWKDVQRHRITLILPPAKEAYTYVNRGKIHRVGDDALIVDDANYSLLMTAYEEWHKRNDRFELAKMRREQKKREESEARAREFREFMAAHEAQWNERDAARVA